MITASGAMKVTNLCGRIGRDWNAIKALLKPYAESSDTSTRYQFGEAMALRGDAEDVPILLRLLADADTDVRISAANALLAIERK